MKQTISDLTDAERGWVAAQLERASKFVESFSPGDAAQPISVAALDRAFGAWLATGETDAALINEAINCVGVAFGQLLVEGVELAWVVATDEHGSDLAVHGLPGKGDVLIYPANFVAKRWERRETNFMARSYEQMADQVRSLKERP